MPMHHLLLLVVLLGWILFLFLTWQIALPLYVLAVIISLVVYGKVKGAQTKAPIIGERAMVGDHAVVARVDGDGVEVEYKGEIWRAISPDPLQQGQKVMIKAVEGLTLKVVPLKPGERGQGG
jgi:membrane protein implicated in regulation of membrane protease activity